MKKRVSKRINLPKKTKRERLNKKEFIALAKRVKKIFEEEEKYIEKNENNQRSKFYLSS